MAFMLYGMTAFAVEKGIDGMTDNNGETQHRSDNDGNMPRERYEICGVVTDETGEPLAGATIRILGTVYAAATTTDGKFSIKVNEQKQFQVTVSFMGYETQSLVVNASKESQPLRISLHQSSNMLDETVVTGSITERPLKDVPILTRVISQKDIQALNPSNLESLLQYSLPGLQIGYNAMSQLPEIKYLGMDGQYLLFLLDGERISGEGSDHNIDFSRINIDDIERIEVIHGAQSTIYGSNALGGVVNIITHSANRPVAASLTARYAGNDGQKYSGLFGIKRNYFNSLSSLTFRTLDTYRISDGENTPFATIYGYNIWDFTQKLGYAFNEKLSAEFKGTTYWNQRRIHEGLLFQEYYVAYTLGGKIKYMPTKSQALCLNYIYDDFKKDHHFFRIDSTALNYRNIKQALHLDYSGQFGKNSISAGAEADFEYLKHYMFRDSATRRITTFAFYMQDELILTKQLEMVGGLRADYHEKYHWHLTPKLSLRYRPAAGTTLRMGYAHGFRSPSLKELYMEYNMGGLGWFMIYGNPNLKPETSRQFTASAEYSAKGWNASLSFLHNRFNNRIEYIQISNSSNLRYINTQHAKLTSVEAILRHRFGCGLTLTGSYVYTYDYAEADGRNASNARPHSAVFNALYQKKFGKIAFSAALNSQWASAFHSYVLNLQQLAQGSNKYTAASYPARTIVSANVSASFPRGIRIGIGADNLLNHKDRAADSTLQLPQRGFTMNALFALNIADFFHW